MPPKIPTINHLFLVFFSQIKFGGVFLKTETIKRKSIALNRVVQLEHLPRSKNKNRKKYNTYTVPS